MVSSRENGTPTHSFVSIDYKSHPPICQFEQRPNFSIILKSSRTFIWSSNISITLIWSWISSESPALVDGWLHESKFPRMRRGGCHRKCHPSASLSPIYGTSLQLWLKHWLWLHCSLFRTLGTKTLLLILDNFSHVSTPLKQIIF